MNMQFCVTLGSVFPTDLNGPYAEGQAEDWSDTNVGEKIRDLKEVAMDITAAKKAFLVNFIEAHKNIEKVVRNLSGSISARQKELQNNLREVGNEKILKWEKQIQLCQQAEQSLTNINENFFRRVEAVQGTFNEFAVSVGFIDAGEIEFRANVEDVVKDLKNLGTLSFEDEGKPSEKLHPRFVIEGRDKITGKLWEPYGICTDATGRILVADYGNDMIQTFNEFGHFLFHFGRSGTGQGEFNRPSGIAIDKKCRIVVSDKDNHRIQIFTFTGKFLVSFGQKGTEPGEFQYPTGVDVNENCDIAVCDKQNHRIQLFNSHGRFIALFRFNENISDPNPRVCPRGVAFQPDGSLVVTDFSSRCILLIDKNFSVVTKIEVKNSILKTPQGIACNRCGMFAVADGGCNKVQMCDLHGNLLRSFNVPGTNPEKLNCFQGLCFHPDGGFVIADLENHRVLVF